MVAGQARALARRTSGFVKFRKGETGQDEIGQDRLQLVILAGDFESGILEKWGYIFCVLVEKWEKRQHSY